MYEASHVGRAPTLLMILRHFVAVRLGLQWRPLGPAVTPGLLLARRNQ